MSIFMIHFGSVYSQSENNTKIRFKAHGYIKNSTKST